MLQLAQGHEARQRRRHAQGGVGRLGFAGVRGRAASRRACQRGARGGARRVLGGRDGASRAHPRIRFERAEVADVAEAAASADAVVVATGLGLGRLGRVARAPDRPRSPGVLRRRRAHRHGRLARPLQGVLPKPLRRRRGRLPERPFVEGRVRCLRPCAGGRRARHPPRLRIEGPVPSMPAHRGSGARRTRHAALRHLSSRWASSTRARGGVPGRRCSCAPRTRPAKATTW